MFVSIQKSLYKKVRFLGMQDMMDFKKINEGWSEFLFANFPRGWGVKIRPSRLKKATLFIKCANSVWLNEFKMKQEFLLGRIKKRFKDIKIDQIRLYN